MKKILIALSLFLIASCASTEQPKKEPTSNIGAIGKALEKIVLPN